MSVEGVPQVAGGGGVPKTIADLIKDVLPRLVNAPKAGISIYHAASAVAELIYKTLLDRNSDLVASGSLELSIAALDCSATLPIGFIAMAEKPLAHTATDEWPLEPAFLTEDLADTEWWKWYGGSGTDNSGKVKNYKIIGSTFYVKPKTSEDITITGKFHQQPSGFTSPTDEIPWNQFYDVFRDGVVWIIMKGLVMPDADQAFMLFFQKRVNPVINSRLRPIPNVRTSRRNFS